MKCLNSNAWILKPIEQKIMPACQGGLCLINVSATHTNS